LWRLWPAGRPKVPLPSAPSGERGKEVDVVVDEHVVQPDRRHRVAQGLPRSRHTTPPCMRS
jgi:hypothetical protein